MFLTRDQIVNSEDRKPVDYAVPEWGGNVQLRALSISERNDVESLVLEDNAKKRKENLQWLRAKTIAYGLLDGNGNRIFNPANRDDLRLINSKNSEIMERLFERIQELSGMRKKDVEEAEGNFENPQEEDSFSD